MVVSRGRTTGAPRRRSRHPKYNDVQYITDWMFQMEGVGEEPSCNDLDSFAVGTLKFLRRPATLDEILDTLILYQPWRLQLCNGDDDDEKRKAMRNTLSNILPRSRAFVSRTKGKERVKYWSLSRMDLGPLKRPSRNGISPKYGSQQRRDVPVADSEDEDNAEVNAVNDDDETLSESGTRAYDFPTTSFIDDRRMFRQVTGGSFSPITMERVPSGSSVPPYPEHQNRTSLENEFLRSPVGGRGYWFGPTSTAGYYSVPNGPQLPYNTGGAWYSVLPGYGGRQPVRYDRPAPASSVSANEAASDLLVVDLMSSNLTSTPLGMGPLSQSRRGQDDFHLPFQGSPPSVSGGPERSSMDQGAASGTSISYIAEEMLQEPAPSEVGLAGRALLLDTYISPLWEEDVSLPSPRGHDMQAYPPAYIEPGTSVGIPGPSRPILIYDEYIGWNVPTYVHRDRGDGRW